MGQPCSTVTRRLVFFTELDNRLDIQRTQASQIDQLGVDTFRRELSAASMIVPTQIEWATNVTWLPCLTMRALPMGTR